MIRQIDSKEQLTACLAVIHESFATVAEEMQLTRENCPNHTSFLPLKKLQQQFEAGRLLFGVFHQEKQVGYFSLERKSDDVFELDHLGVLPEYRHRGYGRQMITYAGSVVKKRGGRKITVGIIEENTRLKEWYASMGFVHTGTKKFSGLPFTVGFMEWEIAK